MAQSICESSVEDVKHLLAPIHGSRACLAIVTGNAENCYFHAKLRLELEEELRAETGKDTAALAGAYNDLAHALSMNKLYAKGIPLLQRSKAIREGLEGFKPSWNYSPLHEMGLNAWLRGSPEEAADCLLQALHDREQELGRNDKESNRYAIKLHA
jgi:hypothetical protein